MVSKPSRFSNYMTHNIFNEIDIDFDFTTDTPHYWDCFWDNGLGTCGNDPDAFSQTLRRYHRILWSKTLPNGECLNLKESNHEYLSWNGHRFGSDSITASFRYEKNRSFLEEVENGIPNYRGYVEDFLRKAYTIGGCIIFPKHNQSINQCRGVNPLIRDRFDLTLECIRKYYLDESSPLYETLKKDEWFFELFVDFKGYVDFFFLQDCVSKDYSKVLFWLGNGDFTVDNMPKTVEEYTNWISLNLEFVRKRNTKIREYLDAFNV